MTPAVVLVWEWTENLEAMAAIDTLVDIMVDAFTAMPQFSTGAIWSDFSVADEEYQVGDYLYPSVRFTFPNVSAMDGRI
jgi:5-carboxymethyl-2-hydroxymuconate isomerase